MLTVIRNHFILEALKKHSMLTLTSLCTIFTAIIVFVWILPNKEYTKLGLCVAEQIAKGNYQNIFHLCYNRYKQNIAFDSFEQHIEFDDYPMILNPDSLYLSDIGDKGWKIKMNIPSNNKDENNNKREALIIEDWTTIIPLNKNLSYKYIGIISSEFNNGKTWLLNQITGNNFPSGLDYEGETKGICFVLPKNENDKYIFIDTEGKKRPVPENKLQDRSMTDLFVEELIPEISDIIIYVVKELDADSQISLKKLIQRVATLSRGSVSPKKLFVVHNYLRIIDPDVVDQHINRDIIVPYAGQKEITDIGIFYYHHDIETELEIRHFIMANHDSKAGKIWNLNTLSLLNGELRAGFFRKRDFMEHLKFHLSGLMREYFKSPQKDIIEKEFINSAETEWKPQDNNYKFQTQVYDLFRRGLAWLGGNNKDIKYILSTENNADIRVPEEIQNEIKNKNDPWELILSAVDKQYTLNGCNHQAIISLKNQRIIEYESVNEIGQRPQVGPDINCRTLKNKMNTIWVLECDVAGGILVSNLNDKINVYDKIGVKIDDENNFVSVFGTISKGIDVGKENFKKYGQLIIEHEDKPTYGWFWKSYKAPAWIQKGWRKRNQTIIDGRLLVVVDTR